MNDRHQEAMAYWQRLRKDKLSNLAVGSLLKAGLLTPLSLIAVVFPRGAGAMHDRGKPLCWLLMLPLAAWGSDLASSAGDPCKPCVRR